jgi:hypothetical protein
MVFDERAVSVTRRYSKRLMLRTLRISRERSRWNALPKGDGDPPKHDLENGPRGDAPQKLPV